MTDSNIPLTSRHFLSFETIAAGLFTLFVAVCAWVWRGHADEFRVLRSDVKAISVVIPTLVTKAEFDEKLDKMATKEEMGKVNEKLDKMATKGEMGKVNEKLDALIVSVNQLQVTITTQQAVNNHRLDVLEKMHPQAEHHVH